MDGSDGQQSLPGHSTWADGLCFSNDTSILASASLIDVKIWRIADAECLLTLETSEDCSRVLAFSPNDNNLFAAMGRSQIIVLNTKRWSCLHILEYENLHNGWANHMAFSPDSTQLGVILGGENHNSMLQTWQIGTSASSADRNETPGVSRYIFRGVVDSRGDDGWFQSPEWLFTSQGFVTTKPTPSTFTTTDRDEIHEYLVRELMPDGFNDDDLYAAANHQYRGLGLSANRDWIQFDSINKVWLPEQYRPWRESDIVACQEMIAYGTASGRLLMISLSQDGFREYVQGR
jgi:WD40 repeat protein